MTSDLGTTNLLLGIMAAVSLIEGVGIITVCVCGFLLYRRVRQVVEGIEERQVAPAATRVNAILDDVKDVTSTLRKQVGFADAAVDWAGRHFRKATRRAAS